MTFTALIIIITAFILSLPKGLEQTPQKPKKAVTDEARLQMKINRGVQKEKQVKQLKKELIKEVYTYNPNGSIWEFNEWKEKVNLEDKARNPHRYQVTVRKPPRQKAKKF